MKSILTIGEILVEIMATEKGDGFLEPVKLVGGIVTSSKKGLYRRALPTS
jgi:hypothetical protein